MDKTQTDTAMPGLTAPGATSPPRLPAAAYAPGAALLPAGPALESTPGPTPLPRLTPPESAPGPTLLPGFPAPESAPGDTLLPRFPVLESALKDTPPRSRPARKLTAASESDPGPLLMREARLSAVSSWPVAVVASPEPALPPAMEFRDSGGGWRRRFRRGGSAAGDGGAAENMAEVLDEGAGGSAGDEPPGNPPPPEDPDPNRDYPRPWFYRPEFYIGFFVFPPVWSVLTLRSPWNRNALVGGVAWAILIVGGIFAFQWATGVNPFFWIPDSGDQVPRGPRWANLVIFLPGTLLTILTQVQWQAHRAQHGPPPSEQAESGNPTAAASPPPAAPPRSSDAPGPPPPRPRRRARRRGR